MSLIVRITSTFPMLIMIGQWRMSAPSGRGATAAPNANIHGYVLWVPLMTFLTTMAAMPASTAFAIGDVRMSTIGLDPEASC